MESNFYVYGHYTADTDELFYVGKGRGFRSNEKSKLRRSKFWHNVASKHGVVVRIIKENLSEGDAFDLERTLIRLHGKRYDGSGTLVNLTDGGEGTSGFRRENVVISEDTRKKISNALVGKQKPPRSKTHSDNISKSLTGRKIGSFDDEHKRKISEANKGRVFSEDHRRKLSAKKKGTKRSKHSPETLEKMRITAKAREARRKTQT
jgi:hypothetical protein